MMKSMLRMRLLLLTPLVLGLLLPGAAAKADLPTASPRVPVTGLKIMNYYPATNGWEDMWRNYSHATTVSDFAAISSLGANTVRIIVQPDAVGYPNVSPNMRADLDDAVAVAASEHLSVQLTLFDLWHNYGDVSGSETWVSSLLQDLGGNTTIALVELQNEMPLSASSISWTKTMLPYLSTVLPGVPRTLSQAASGGFAAINSMLTSIPSSDIDAIDVHVYGDPSLATQELGSVVSVANGRPVFIGEAGASTAGTAAGEEYQARFFEVLGQTAHDLGLPPPGVWMLNDVTSASGVHLTTTSSDYGLRRADGTWKPAAGVVRSIFSGGLPEDWDGDMHAEANDAPGMTTGAWTEWDHNDGIPTVTQMATPAGGQALCFSQTGGTPLALPSAEQSFPVLAPNESFSVTAYVKRTNGTGQERVALSGYGPSGNYLGQVQSEAATGSGTWQQLHVSATVPAGVARVEVHLKAGNESGTACWANVSISQSAA